MHLSPSEMTKLWDAGKPFAVVARELFSTREIPQFPATQSDFDEQMARAEKLVAALVNGTLIAVGYPAPQRAGDYPLAIPQEVWEDKNTVNVSLYGVLEHDDYSYIKVRICVPESYTTKTGGRPTLKIILTAAFEELAQSGEIDPEKTQTSQIALVRERAALLYPMHKAFVEKAVDRSVLKYLSPLFKGLKSRQK